MSTTRWAAAAAIAVGLFIHGASHAREITMRERIEAQRAIEQVYWSHRIWPEGNPGPKPSLSEIMSDVAIREKVEVSLRASALLDTFWHRPLRASDIQAEIDRMARDSKSPDILRELFDALSNDPFLIAESLARPALASRLAEAAYASDESITAPKPSFDEWAREQDLRGKLDDSALAAPAGGWVAPLVPQAGCVYDTWTPMTTVNAPVARDAHTVVWTGAEMIVWGGTTGSVLLNTGGRYDPATDMWTATSTAAPVPVARQSHTVVWTGTEMIVWGGVPNGGGALANGGRYNPGANTWTAVSTGLNTPSQRTGHAAVWTGTRMVVWGGFGGVGGQYPNTGGRYDPVTDSWLATTLTNVPTGRYQMTAVWTGTEMIVWGGLAATSTNTGGRYDPVADTWTATSTGAGVPPPSILHTAVWSGTEMIVSGSFASPVRRYTPGTDTWSTTAGVTGRQIHSAVWTGFDMIVWGGRAVQKYLATGFRYVSASNTFTATSLDTGAGGNVPAGREAHTAVWTGGTDRRMIVWGGRIADPTVLTNTGGLYCAAECAPNGGACDDMSVCTTSDACTLGDCTGAPVNCADSDFCTTDTCDAVTGCHHACTASCIPGEIAHLNVGFNRSTVSWDYTSGGAASVHDLVRGRCDQFPVGTGAAETCVLSGSGSTFADDFTQPPTGRAFWYDVRGRHPCGAGPYGSSSNGLPRTTTACP